MKQKLFWLFSATIIIFLQGCINIEMNGVVNEDGTLTVSARYDMSKMEKAAQGLAQGSAAKHFSCEDFSKGSVKPTGCFKVADGIFDLRWDRIDGTINNTVTVEQGLFSSTYELNATSMVTSLGKSLDDNKATTKKDEFAALRTLGVTYSVTLSMPGTITPSADVNITNNIAKLDGLAILEDHKEILLTSKSYNTLTLLAVAFIIFALIIFGVYSYIKKQPLNEKGEKIQKALVASMIALILGSVALITMSFIKKSPTQEVQATPSEINATDINTTPQPDQNTTTYLIESGHVGDISLGRRASKLTVALPFQLVKMTKMVNTEGEESQVTYYQLSENGIPLLEAYVGFDVASGQNNDTIEDITVLSDKYATAKGIKKSSTLEELIKAYPSNTLSYSYISDSYTLSAEGIEFTLDPVGFKNKEFGHLTENASDGVTLPSSAFQPSTKVISIRIFKGL